MNDYKELIEELRDFSNQIELDNQRYDIPYGIHHEETLDKAADAIEQLVKEYNELDKAHDEMFLELCKVKKERDALKEKLKIVWEWRGVTNDKS